MTRGPYPTPMLQAIGDRLVVEPYFDADKIGSIYIPEAFKNPEPQQGLVISAGPLTPIHEGAYVLFHPFRSQPLGNTGLISLHDKDVVAYLGKELMPREEHVMVLPDWATKYGQKGLIYLPPVAQDDIGVPVVLGTVVRSGCTQFQAGDKVVVQPGAGAEVGYKDTVYYFIHHDDVLATYDHDR